MPVNKYFQNDYNTMSEQRLVEDLIQESIKIFGQNAFYCPRNSSQEDIIYGEDPLKVYQSAFPIEVYVVNAEGYEGQKDFFSKFGLEIREEITVWVSRRTFTEQVPTDNFFNRPKEGDLIFVPFLKGSGELYEITYVDVKKDFYALGRKLPYYYEIKLELFKYSHEPLDTGLPNIDRIAGEDAYTISFTLDNVKNNFLVFENVYQGPNLEFSTCLAEVTHWDNPTSTMNVVNISGVFSTNEMIIGAVSGATANVVSYNPLQNDLMRAFDNDNIQTEGVGNIDFSEENPFGDPGGYE